MLFRSTLPEKLEQLVPEYIEEVPVDPYDGFPFRYDPKKVIEFDCVEAESIESVSMTGIVYSVGEDLIDQGGSTRVETGSKSQAYWRTHGEDFVYGIDEVIKMEWPEEKKRSRPRRRRPSATTEAP